MTPTSNPDPEDYATDQNDGTTSADPLFESIAELMSDIQKRTATELRNIQESHQPKLLQVLSELRDTLHNEVNTTLQGEFEARFQTSLEEVRHHFQKRFEEASADLKNDTAGNGESLTELRQHYVNVTAELTSKESELAYVVRETAAMVEDPDVEISRIIRQNALQSELKAYIKGLRYQRGERSEHSGT